MKLLSILSVTLSMRKQHDASHNFNLMQFVDTVHSISLSVLCSLILT